jgi:hypothetical protein
MRLIHISDLHFGAEDPRLPQRLRAAIIQAAPDMVALSGDLTQSGLKPEFEEAKAFLDSFTFPLLVVPGNHDVQGTWKFWERFLTPWKMNHACIRARMPKTSRWLDSSVPMMSWATPLTPPLVANTACNIKMCRPDVARTAPPLRGGVFLLSSFAPFLRRQHWPCCPRPQLPPLPPP